jgi:DNA-binding response OmpR family regulator
MAATRGHLMFETTILIVDDEVAYCNALGDALRSYGYNVHTAHNAHEALSLLKWLVPDLLILDIMMPQIDGLLLLKQLRSNPEWDHVPIIIASALAEQHQSNVAMEAGANHYLVKPYTMEILRTTVGQFLPVA